MSYSIFRDEELTDVQGGAMLELDNAQDRLIRALEQVQKDATDALERAKNGQRAAWGSQIFGQYPVDAELAAKEVSLHATFVQKLGVSAEKVNAVLTSS